MTDGTSDNNWPGVDERSVVAEMIRDRGSKFWEACSKFVERRVYSKAKNIPIDHREVLVQEILYKVAKYLPDFHFQCPLKNWLSIIIERRIIDMYRRLQNEGEVYSPLPERESLNEGEHEIEGMILSDNRSAEDVAVTNENLQNALTALFEYADLHSNSIRNRHIIQMVIFEGYTHKEAAEAAGCKAPVVRYVIHEAQRYAREKMGDDL